jgi:hypothetical protein
VPNKWLKAKVFSHLPAAGRFGICNNIGLFFRVMLLCKVVLLNKFFNNNPPSLNNFGGHVGNCFISGIVVLGRPLIGNYVI